MSTNSLTLTIKNSDYSSVETTWRLCWRDNVKRPNTTRKASGAQLSQAFQPFLPECQACKWSHLRTSRPPIHQMDAFWSRIIHRALLKNFLKFITTKTRGSNLHLIKPLDLAGHLQEIKRKAELHPNYVINKIKTVGNSTGQKAQIPQHNRERKNLQIKRHSKTYLNSPSYTFVLCGFSVSVFKKQNRTKQTKLNIAY